MQIEIITIGDEILSGDIINTNASYLSEQLWLNGFEVTYHTSVRDDAPKIREALLIASERAQIVLVSGGLGPTADDFTIEVAAKTFRRKLILDENYVHYLERLFKKWDRPLSENNKKQAYIPLGARTFQNHVGTAPGIGLKFKKTQYYFLPGVPKELKQLFKDFILPEIISCSEKKTFFACKLIKCFGMAESELDHALKDLYEDRLNIQNVRIGFRAHFPETFIKMSAWDPDLEKAHQFLKDVEQKIIERVGVAIYGSGEDTLESVLGKLLIAHQKTVATAESCTGGLIAHRITNIPGASQYFKNGVVAYSNEAKVKLLGVSPDVIKKYGAVSSQCAREMAQGIRRISKTDYGIAVTGIAGPDGGGESKPVGTVHIALASSQGMDEKKHILPRNRDWFKALVASLAMDCLRKELIKSC